MWHLQCTVKEEIFKALLANVKIHRSKRIDIERL